MRVALFYHSLVSDWNHGNAHFLRGVASELMARGHELRIFEPAHSWSRQSLVSEYGEQPLRDFASRYPKLRSTQYMPDTIDLDRALDGVDLVLVHEWSDHGLVSAIGQHHRRNPEYFLLFHDTHHRSVTEPEGMAAYDLSGFDGVLAYGEAIRQIYLRRGWARQVWTWHEAADTRVFHPVRNQPHEGDLVWIGNWGDDERTAELHEFLIEPARRLGLRTRVYGVRYPEAALEALQGAGIEYGGWLPNYTVPEVFARFRVTVHVPRRPYTRVLPGIPTIRPFEALACGIPMISAPWDDVEGLFTPGRDYLVARNGDEMQTRLQEVLSNPALASELARHGRETILNRHTCAHRVDQLLAIYQEERVPRESMQCA
ncbi:MAG: glycosyltransferase [Acidobacteriota bacterium]|nr:glycosyltransferase [Acidobacteriota bacterium]